MYWGECGGDKIALEAIHFGGGTPTVICDKQIRKVVNALKENFIISKDCLISIEGNVKDLSDYRVITELLINVPEINRISFGVQTFDEEVRKIYGLAKVEKVYQTINNIVENRIEDFNIDLMYGFPEQNIQGVIDDIERAFSAGVNCIDLYGLNVFPGTSMERELRKNGKYNKYQNDRRKYYPLFQYLAKREDIYFIMSNTISMKPQEPNKYLRYHLGGNNKEEIGNVIGVGASARGYVNGFTYKNHININEYIKSVKEKKIAISLMKYVDEYERMHRTAVMFPNFMKIEKAAFPQTENIQKVLNKLIVSGWIKERDGLYYIEKENGYWVGNISGLFYSDEQRSKMIRTAISNISNGLNMYNQDKMLI